MLCVASLLAPMAGYAVAFSLLGTAEKPRDWRIIGAGVAAGLVTVGDNLLVSISFESSLPVTIRVVLLTASLIGSIRNYELRT